MKTVMMFLGYVLILFLGIFIGTFWGGERLEKFESVDLPSYISYLGRFESDDLLTEYSTGTLIQEDFDRLLLSDENDKRFSVIQYGGHHQEYSQQAREQGMHENITLLMFRSVAFYHHPFVASLAEPEILSRLGIACVESQIEKNLLHDEFYTRPPQDMNAVLDAGIKAGLGSAYQDCVSEGSAQMYVRQSMQKAREYFDITKAPSYVLIDNRTKYRVLIPGLYSLAEVGEVMTREFDFEGL